MIALIAHVLHAPARWLGRVAEWLDEYDHRLNDVWGD